MLDLSNQSLDITYIANSKTLNHTNNIHCRTIYVSYKKILTKVREAEKQLILTKLRTTGADFYFR